jgi:methylamine---glutamate N-methyltransferase subunit B
MTDRPAPALAVPEIRDYHKINAELVRLLDEGHASVRLAGVEGQRLLLSNLSGPWSARVEVEGRAGPELAADLDAPDLLVVCSGPAADGAGRGLRGGRLLILGEASESVGYGMNGGTIVVRGAAGHRAGLGMTGGVLVMLGPIGRLAGERQAGGTLFGFGERFGPHAGRGRTAGRLVLLSAGDDPLAGAPDEDARAYRRAMAGLDEWLGA